jgi:hypothetical protein
MTTSIQLYPTKNKGIGKETGKREFCVTKLKIPFSR